VSIVKELKDYLTENGEFGAKIQSSDLRLSLTASVSTSFVLVGLVFTCTVCARSFF
jgi:hypothetical protein